LVELLFNYAGDFLKQTFRFFSPYFKDYKTQYILVIIGILMVVSSSAGTAQLMKYVVDDLLIDQDTNAYNYPSRTNWNIFY
jgi:ABC-type multidrug transport system fused ATPase/permease subunit